MLAGALVITTVLTAIVVVILLAGGLERLDKHDYVARFSIADGVTGLEPGSRVMVGGRAVGVVRTLRFDFQDDGSLNDVDVTISIDRRITLRQGAAAFLISPLLGGSGTINFPSIGDGPPLPANAVIPGRIAPPTMLAQAGYGPEQADQLRAIIRNVNDASEKANTVLDDARTVTGDVREKWPAWSDRVDSISRNVDETAARGPAIAEDLQRRLEEVRELLATARGYLDENRDNVREGLASFRSIGEKGDAFMDRLNSELADKTAAFLDEARVAFDRAREAVDGIALLRDEQLPSIRRMMANFRLASDQLATMMGEVRRSPWRLLYRPDKRELNFELLYDSVRSYAAAVSDLRNAGEAIQSIAAGTPDVAARSPDRIDGMIADLNIAFERYREAEQEFLRQVMLHAEPAGR